MNSRAIMGDSFSVSLMIALGIHALLLIGITFVLEINPLLKAAETLDVVLVNFRSEAPPEDAEFLAQAAQQGGSDADDTARPSTEISAPVPSLNEGDMPDSAPPRDPVPSESSREQVVSQQPDAEPVQQLTHVEQPVEEVPSAAQLMQQSRQISRLQADLGREGQFKSRLKRREFVSANTKEYEYATYMHAWVAKVERVGNLNYPAELRQKRLRGDLLMTVGINQDGSIESIEIHRSSGLPELDQAAERIVRLAAPYAPLTEDIRARVDVLHITRTWRFSSGLQRLE